MIGSTMCLKLGFLCALHSIGFRHTCLKISPYGVHSPNLHKFSLVDVTMTTKHGFIVCEFTKYTIIIQTLIRN